MRFAAVGVTIALSGLALVPGVLAQDRPARSATEGETLFVRECGICHLEGGTGTMMLARRLGEDKALLHRRTDLPPQYVEAVVRRGINSMPTITRVELPDAELRAIVGYLTRAPAAQNRGAGQ